MTRGEALKILDTIPTIGEQVDALEMAIKALEQPEPKWIPCSERLPRINQHVLLSSTAGEVYVGHRVKPEIVWQVTESDGRKHWVYDPESYTDDIDSLPKSEDCAFDSSDTYTEGWLSVSSINYRDRFEGIIAWMPLPESYSGE